MTRPNSPATDQYRRPDVNGNSLRRHHELTLPAGERLIDVLDAAAL